MDLGPASTADSALSPGLPESAWVQPIPDARVLPTDGDPAELAAERDTIRLAFVAALQHLPARQRAVLILREVLKWQATEVAELLDTTVASVNSALQRARATLDAAALEPTAAPIDDRQRELVARYVDAFERYDVESLVTLLRDDVTFSMPPYELWLQGPAEVANWLLGTGIGCQGSRLVPIAANGCAAFGSYRPAGPGAWEPWSIVVLDLSGNRISAIQSFLYPDWFPVFGLPTRLDAGDE